MFSLCESNLLCVSVNLFVTFLLHFHIHNSLMYSLCESLFSCVFKFKLLHLPLNLNDTATNSTTDVCAVKFLHLNLLYKFIKLCVFVYYNLTFMVLFHLMFMPFKMFILLHTLIYLCCSFLKLYIHFYFFPVMGEMWYLWIHKYISKLLRALNYKLPLF